jgi:hypothetical protein
MAEKFRLSAHANGPKSEVFSCLVTVVPYSYPTEPFQLTPLKSKLLMEKTMQGGTAQENKRHGSRTKAVLPVRIKGKDATGEAFDEMAHTLDVTASGVRLGSVRRELNPQDEVTIFYRQRKMQCRVVWTKKLKGTSEFQVGLHALTQEREVWGLSLADQKHQTVAPEVSGARASGIA